MNFLSPLWTFTVGANLAAYAGKNIKPDESLFASFYFRYALAVIALAVPCNAYLLWTFPGWSTFFFFKDRMVTPAASIVSAIAVLALLDLIAGVAGFVLAASRMRSSGHVAAHSLWQYSSLAYYGVMGLAYKVYTYSGTFREWDNGVPHEAADFLNTPMFYSLAAMYVVFAPALFYPAMYWPSTQLNVAISEKEKNALDMRTGINYGMGLAVGVAVYAVAMAIDGPSLKVALANDRFGVLTPLFSYFVAQLLGSLVFLWPVFDIPLARIPSSMKKRMNSRKVKTK